MTGDPRLETYLTSLERVLKPFPTGDRAEIVTEIKSHVLSTLERDPQARLDSVLTALGEPETVANRYLLERGLKPTKPPISPIVKWLVIGFLGTFAMILITLAVLVTRFTPLLHVDDSKDQVSLFGGLIEVDGANGKIFISGSLSDEGELSAGAFAGSVSVNELQEVSLAFNSGKFELVNAEEGKLTWSCKGHGRKVTDRTPEPQMTDKLVSLDLTGSRITKCEVGIPKTKKVSLNAHNGKLVIDEPKYNLSVQMSNGKVELNPDESIAYKYDLNVTNGKAEKFESSNKPDAYLIAITLANGKISRGK